MTGTDEAPWVCRVLPHQDAGGPANMARDEALLDLVTREPGSAAFRTYGWTEPTLSLGYFQSVRDAEFDPRWRGVPLVRRPTGGGAIWHDREVTYALAVPRAHPLARGTAELYRAVHGFLAGLLVGSGADARRRGVGGPAGPGGRPFLCFADRDAEDVVIGPAKVVGSAQRRRAGAVLQHGSVLLRGSPRTPELPGVCDLGPAPDDPAWWSERLGRGLPESLGFVPRPEDWSGPGLARAGELETAVYRDDGWTRRR